MSAGTNLGSSEGSWMEGDPGADALQPDRPLAVLLVGGEHDLGASLIRQFCHGYARHFGQILLVSVGVMDYSILDSGVDSSIGFKGSEEAERLRAKTLRQLEPHLSIARRMGLKAFTRVSVATNAAEEIDRVSDELSKAFPRASFFVGELMFLKKPWYHRLLHGGTGEAIRRRLQKKGYPVTVLPVVLSA